MKKEAYQYYYKCITSRRAVKELAKLHPEVSYNTLFCIYSQKLQELTKKTLPLHSQPEKKARYHERLNWKEEFIYIL